LWLRLRRTGAPAAQPAGTDGLIEALKPRNTSLIVTFARSASSPMVEFDRLRPHPFLDQTAGGQAEAAHRLDPSRTPPATHDRRRHRLQRALRGSNAP
jgi:hypothetical protein